MKKISLISTLIILTLTLTGCLGLSIGGGTRTQPQNPTLGQQLIDLQNAKNTGAISDAEYEVQKQKLLHGK